MMETRPQQSQIARWVPAISWISSYSKKDLGRDLAAGLVLSAMLVPQGMAYAELAGLPPVTGLYTTVASLVAYGLMGPSRILVLGPDSSLAPLIAAAIAPLVIGRDPGTAVALAAALAVFTGVACVLAGVGRFGTITEFLSKPVRVGYLNGIALLVVVSQLPKLAGFSTDADGFLDELRGFVAGVRDGMVEPAALMIGLGGLIAIVVLRRWQPAVPWILLAVVVSMGVTAAFDLDIPLVGALPKGLPAFDVPGIEASDLWPLTVAALGIALVSFADTSALATTFAIRRGTPVDPDREIVALGSANILAGFTGGFPTSASSSRTAVADAVGARTQLAGLIAAAVILVLLVAANALLADLPSATLAAIVIAAASLLIDLETTMWLIRVRASEFYLLLGAMLGVLFVGVLEGIGIAIGLSLLNFIRRARRPHDAVLGRVEGRKGYHDLSRHVHARTIPGLVLFRFDAPLFFANANHFALRVQKVVSDTADPVRVVIAAEPITDIDTTGAEVLGDLLDQLESRGVTLAFAELKGPVKDRLRRYGLYDRIGDEQFHSTLGTAVSAYLRETDVEWTDWTDR